MSNMTMPNMPMPTPSYDLFSPAFKRDPFPTYAAMRRHHPVYPHAAPSGDTIWYITRYADVVAVLKDNAHFVKNPAPSRPQPATHHDYINDNMLFADPPNHTRLRALVNQAFTPRRVADSAARIQAIANDLLDAAAPTFDLIADFALPLPVRVICDLLGVPPADQAQVAAWSQAIVSPGSRNLSFRARKRQVRELVAYLRGLFAARQQQPQDDLITALVQAEEAGQRLTEAELSSMVVLLLVTGHETTVNLIGSGIWALLRHPEQMAWLRTNLGGMEMALEELLRFESPVETTTNRWVAHDLDFGGQTLRRGDIIRAALAAANRDETIFPNPDTLDLQRSPNRHLAFGHGSHYCLGAPLARLEGQIAFTTLLTRFPHLRLTVPPEALRWRSGVLLRGLEALPLAGN